VLAAISAKVLVHLELLGTPDARGDTGSPATNRVRRRESPSPPPATHSKQRGTNHCQRAAAQAAVLWGLLAPSATTTWETAALLHDIGYAPGLVRTGFHPIDGATFLQAEGVAEEIVSLVAHHSSALTEAELAGLGALTETSRGLLIRELVAARAASRRARIQMGAAPLE
jgi:putative nucleotidyltransferase with HDIG domain